MGIVSLPVHQLHPHRVDALASQMVQNLITQPVLPWHVPETLQEEPWADHTLHVKLWWNLVIAWQTDHFVFPPAPLEVQAAIKPPLEDSPASTTCLHVTVHLQEEKQKLLMFFPHIIKHTINLKLLDPNQKLPHQLEFSIKRLFAGTKKLETFKILNANKHDYKDLSVQHF